MNELCLEEIPPIVITSDDVMWHLIDIELFEKACKLYKKVYTVNSLVVFYSPFPDINVETIQLQSNPLYIKQFLEG